MSIRQKAEGLLKNKKLLILSAAALAAVVAAVCLIVNAIGNKAEENKVDEYLNQRFETYGEMNIIADSAEVDGNKNTVAGIKEAFRQGAGIVTLDLCFNSSDVPVICENYDDITKDTLTLEEVLKLLGDEKYSALKINLRIKQLGSLDKFNGLLAKYDMSGRVIISGIDKNRYSLISGEDTAAGLFFDFNPPHNPKKAKKEIESMQEKYGIAGVIIDCGEVDSELADTLNQHGIIFIVGGADEELEMYSALSAGAGNIETAYPEKLTEVCEKWKEQTRENMEKSILNELNNKN